MALLPALASAQSNQAPGSHWGASMYPRLQRGYSVGFEILGFSQFGKDARGSDGAVLKPGECSNPSMQGSMATPCAVRDPYNDIDETVGLNVIGFSWTHPLQRFNLNRSNLLFTLNVIGGWVGDKITQLYQNDVIHNLAKLRHIPREKVACENYSNFAECGIFGAGGELTYQFHSFDRGPKRLGLRPTPLFLSGGGMLSNVVSDLYVQAGVKRFELWGPAWPKLDRIVSLSISTLVRGGVLLNGFVFQEVGNYYVAADGTVGLHFAKYDFPVTLEFGYTGSSGMFVNARRQLASDGREIQSGPFPQALPERFYHLRVEIGEFAFETYNDAPGGKDKGPSFGARVLYNFVPGTWEGNLIDRLVSRWGRNK
ncbi:MAG: hypothetical protein QM778_28700 [Myxococcales bacterium]